MILADPTNIIPHFHALRSEENKDDPYGPVVKCLSMEEEFALLGSLRILGILIA
jgi:V-type H+-transporting ATPase subunit H